MRILSLLPSATEIVYALGLDKDLVGITHECDYPADTKTKNVVIESCLGPDASKLSPGEVDQAIRSRIAKGEGVYQFKPGSLEAAPPDLVLTQGLCDVCAVPYQFVMESVKKLPSPPQVLSMDPPDLTGILVDIRRVGEIANRIDRAGEVVDALEERMGEVAGRTRDLPESKRPRVVIIEWIDPIFAAGHWVPELVELAGGREMLGKVGEPSSTVEWQAVLDARPEVIILAQCGYDIPRARAELPALQKFPGWESLPAVKSGAVYLMDANATLSRPGPRMVDGLEAIARILHPEIFPMLGTKYWEKA